MTGGATRGGSVHPLKVWPYGWAHAGRLVLAFLVMTTVWIAAGFAVTELIEPATGSTETDAAVWFEERRTSALNTVADISSIPSDPPVKVGLLAVLALVLPQVFRRWHDWLFLASALLLEVCVYAVSGHVVGRPRPPVERLSEAPTQSWPSGHVAAAVTFYFGLVIVARWRTDDKRITLPMTVAATVITVAMVGSRLYLGMHYVSDVIGGVALGALCLWVVSKVLHQAVDDLAEEDDDDELAGHLTELAVGDP